MEPGASDATCVTACTCAATCAAADEGTQRSTRPPTAADAVILAVRRMMSPGSPRLLRRGDRKIDFPGQRLVRELVRDLYLQPIVPFRERRERNRLSALELMTGVQIELRRQRLRVETLWIRLVEELLRLSRGLLVEVVFHLDVRFIRAVDL